MKKKIALAITFLTGGLLVIPVLAHNGADDVLAAYEKVSLALAQDDLATAKSAAATLAEKAEAAKLDTVAEHAAELAGSDTLKAARAHLKATEAEAIKLAEASDKYHVMDCPMAKAKWIQSGEKVMNPYMGKRMQQCGSMVKETKGKEGADAGAAKAMKCCPVMG